jgi:hypothetical protein
MRWAVPLRIQADVAVSLERFLGRLEGLQASIAEWREQGDRLVERTAFLCGDLREALEASRRSAQKPPLEE